MAVKASNSTEETVDLLRKLLIVQLGLAGIPQKNIQAIVGVSTKKVNEIMKLVTAK